MDIITYVLSKKYTDKVTKDLAGGLKYQGSKPTISDLPTPSASIKGHLYTVVTNGHEYVCDGTQWIDLSADLNNKQDKLVAGENITIAGDGKTISAQQPDISNKADLPSELPPELKAEGVDYPWFMINMNPTGIDADANLHLVHSGYNFNSKQYFTWPEKVLPMAVTESTGGLLTAADKVKLNKAITEHQDISGKANLPDKLPEELRVPGVDYPWFMINLNPKSIDADGNLILDHSGYNFNTKQYYTWTDKTLPMAASTTNGGLMTAADKVKLNAAITEHQDISGKQDKLTAGDGITIDTNNKISANVRTYKSFPSSWPHSTGTTIASFCAAVNASYKSGEIKIGDAFLGNVNSVAFFSGAYLENGGSLGSAEVSVQIMNPFGQNCVQLLTVTSSNNAPYHWEYTYVDGATSEGWRCWSQHSYVNNKLSSKQDKISAGTNIDITDNSVSVKIDSIDLSGTLADGAWHDGGTLSESDANILLASELNYIWLNNMHRLDFKYKDVNNNLATYAASDGEKSHVVEIVLYGKGTKTWRYKHITEAPDEVGTYVWKCVVTKDGDKTVKTYKWVKE